MELTRAIPALPVRDVAAAVTFYRERLGFDARHREDRFAVLARGDAEVHVWQADDESWRGRPDDAKPVCSGAESFIAGTASCRIQVDRGIDDLYAELRDRGVLHPVSSKRVSETDYGTREFAALDQDGNLLGFFQRVGL